MNWNTLLLSAITAGILPAEAADRPPPTAPHPWPLVLMSFIGALLAAIPVVAFLALFLGRRLMEAGVVPYLVGGGVVIACGTVLRLRRMPLFVESLALTFLLAGLGLVFYAAGRDLHALGYALCAGVSLVLAGLVQVRWVQPLLAALAVILGYGALFEARFEFRFQLIYLSQLFVLLWLGGLVLQQRVLARPRFARHAVTLEWILGGWIVAVLFALVVFPDERFRAIGYGEPGVWVAHGLGLASALAGAVWAWRRWAGLRGSSGIGLLAVLVGLSGVMPSLGLVALVGLVSFTTGRVVQAGAAAVAALWLIGHFYYTLHLDLVTKAQILLAAGLTLAALAWLVRRQLAAHQATALPDTRLRRVLIGLAALATLAVVNLGIWQKEDIIANGRPVFIKLAPVDPRSLMQGDYMALRYEMPTGLRNTLREVSKLTRPKLIGSLDNKGVLSLTRLAKGEPGGSELVIELSPAKRDWTVVSDAWFFKEGDGLRWSRARYGEFRVMPDGRALLVGLADETLQAIRP
ncbi:MAG: GDYXXLXY domain-containing protein [Uliginosibacterium sp.]|nr:GDYXXLXY domain-containing protein [Uliginosibacterium sp.]